MLTGGMLPFDSDLQGTIRLKLAGEAPNLATIVPDMQPALATLVARLLSYDADRRPRSARSLIIALDAAVRAPKRKLRTADLAQQGKAPTVSFPPTKHQRAATKRLRKAQGPGARTYAALAVAAVMIGAAIASIARDHEPSAEARTIREPIVTLQVHAEPIATTPVATTPNVAPQQAAQHVVAPKVAVAKKPRVVHKRRPVVRATPAPAATAMPAQPDGIIQEPAVVDAAAPAQPDAVEPATTTPDKPDDLDALPAEVDHENELP
jgi:hypothetical protein